MTRTFDAIVIGAGPYGLAAAAHLQAAGVDARVQGVPMSFWSTHMPLGMRIRSRWDASHIAHPQRAFTLNDYQTFRQTRFERPMALADFIAYGQWYQGHVVSEIDPRAVTNVAPETDGFRVRLADGETLAARRVVVAAGIAPFAVRPREFDAIPAELASHSSDHRDLGVFAGRRVVVVGGGQSAIESAALLQEAGADTEVIMRRPLQRWVGRAPREGLLGHLLFDRSDVGPALISHVVARPPLYRAAPASARRYMMRRSLAPGASLWLHDRLGGVSFSRGSRITSVARVNGHLRLWLDDGSPRDVDHALLATGYRVDVSRYRFLDARIVRAIALQNGSPVLSSGFESSIAGLYFLGAPAANSFGPLLRFVSGAGFATRTLAHDIARQTSHSKAVPRAIEAPLSERQAS